MPKYPYIPYDKNLVARAGELRKNQTEAEKYFWKHILKREQFSHLTFLRQKPIGHFIIDFYCAKLQLGIEIDGEIHNTQIERDEERDENLKQEFGVKILRYRNEEVLNNTKKVLEDFIEKVKVLTLS